MANKFAGIGARYKLHRTTRTQACRDKKKEWRELREVRYAVEPQYDPVWRRTVLTQPVAIKEIVDFAKGVDAVKFFGSRGRPSQCVADLRGRPAI